ncbi:MAG: SH3 domain-containing protein [Lachnospiraceae bacterium]|nr:SH3 domain-containing protein [Lachnospiraceae bacterium]
MKKLRKVLTLAAALFVVMAAVYPLDVRVEAYVQKLGTITSDTSLYEDASSSASVVMSLASGQSVIVNNEVTGTDGETWYQLYVNDTETGYVLSGVVSVTASSSGTDSTEAAVLTTTTTTTVTTGTISVSSVNVRASATTSSTAVTTLSSGDTFTVLEEETGDDGYIWYQVEFEQNGSSVYGYIRSDLATVTTKEVEVTVDNPDVAENPEESTTTTSAPYRIVSQESTEGETVWYLVEEGSSSGYSIEALLEAANTPVSSSGGGQKVVIVLLIILLIIAAAAAAFFCLRWRDTEANLQEMAEQNRRRRTTRKDAPSAGGSKPQAGQQPRQSASGQPKAPQPAAGQTRTQPAAGQTRAQQSASGQAKPQQSAAGQTRTQQSVQARTQQTVKPKPTGSTQTASKPAAPTQTSRTRTEAAETDARPKTRPQTRTQQKSSYDDFDVDDLDLEDFPNSDDIVKTTSRELKRKPEETASKPKSRRSRNFLDDDDDEDLEFDFLRLDDDDE